MSDMRLGVGCKQQSLALWFWFSSWCMSTQHEQPERQPELI
jgi:hypothetical protein